MEDQNLLSTARGREQLGTLLDRQWVDDGAPNPLVDEGISDEVARQLIRGKNILGRLRGHYGWTDQDIEAIDVRALRWAETLTSDDEALINQPAILLYLHTEGELTTSQLKRIVRELAMVRQAMTREYRRIRRRLWSGRAFYANGRVILRRVTRNLRLRNRDIIVALYEVTSWR